MLISKLIVLNGGDGDYIFVVGEDSGFGSNVKKIMKNEKNDNYIVFLQDGTEIDVVSNNFLLVTKFV